MSARAAVVFAVSLASALVASCAEPVGEVVTCSQSWTCGDDVVADNSTNVREADVGHVFCTRPGTDFLGGTAGAEERSADIAQYQDGFASNCNGVNVGCLNPEEDGEFATCAATCVVADSCDPASTVRVRLN